MAFDAYIFDLDGTILNTLPDLVNLTNMVLEERGMPARTTEEINRFVGKGAWVLLQQAVVPGTPDETIDDILERWKDLYPAYGHKFTKPYDGVPEALAELKARGAKLGVLSNKFDLAVRDVIAKNYPGVFDVARGECDEIPRKPDPTGLKWMMSSLGVDPARTAYVGDSGGDMAVAIAAGAFPVGVSWGYRDVKELVDNGARQIVNAPEELLAIG